MNRVDWDMKLGKERVTYKIGLAERSTRISRGPETMEVLDRYTPTFSLFQLGEDPCARFIW